MNMSRFVLPLVTAVVVAAGCSTTTRTEPPAPVYEKGRQVGGAVSAAESGPSTVETTAIGGPQVQVGGSALPGQIPVPETPAASPEATPAEAPVTLAYVPPAAPAVQPAQPMGSAGESLVSQADAKYRAGDLTGAASLLERAVRVEPRHPLPWNRLARVRLSQGSFGLAAQLAEKSNALAGADRGLKRDNWLVIGEARQRAGDVPGANAARQQADAFR